MKPDRIRDLTALNDIIWSKDYRRSNYCPECKQEIKGKGFLDDVSFGRLIFVSWFNGIDYLESQRII